MTLRSAPYSLGDLLSASTLSSIEYEKSYQLHKLNSLQQLRRLCPESLPWPAGPLRDVSPNAFLIRCLHPSSCSLYSHRRLSCLLFPLSEMPFPPLFSGLTPSLHSGSSSDGVSPEHLKNIAEYLLMALICSISLQSTRPYLKVDYIFACGSSLLLC